MRVWIYIFICCAGVFYACYEPKEGCLDIEAVNYDASADDDCCCTYPALKVDVLQQYGSQVWQTNKAYAAPSGRWFRIKSVYFYLSEFQLFKGGLEYRVADTLGLWIFGAGAADTLRSTFTNDFQLVRRTPLTYTIGSFRESGVFNKMQFRLGLSETANKVAPNKSPSGHPLQLQTEKLWRSRNEGFLYMQIIMARDSAAATPLDTLNFTRSDLGDALFSGNATLTHKTGFDFSVKLTVDYQEFFRGVDLSKRDISAWKNQIKSNLTKGFSVSQ